jgi:hypothetical protein
MEISGQIQALAALPSRKDPQYQLNKRACEHTASLDVAEKIKKLFPIPGMQSRFFSCPASSFVAIPTVISHVLNVRD